MLQLCFLRVRDLKECWAEVPLSVTSPRMAGTASFPSEPPGDVSPVSVGGDSTWHEHQALGDCPGDWRPQPFPLLSSHPEFLSSAASAPSAAFCLLSLLRITSLSPHKSHCSVLPAVLLSCRPITPCPFFPLPFKS